MTPNYTDSHFLMWVSRLGFRLSDYPEILWKAWEASNGYDQLDIRYIQNEIERMK